MGKLSLVAGPVVVALYAAVMVLTIAVWDPAAAVPSVRYPDIVAQLTSTGVDVPGSVLGLIVWGCVGIALTLALSILGATGHLGRRRVAVGQLALIAAGAPAYFIATFSLGMDVADTFGVGGGAHTIVTGVLYVISGFALLALAAIGIRQAAIRRPSPA